MPCSIHSLVNEPRMKPLVRQGAVIAALSAAFFVLSATVRPEMAFGYGYGHETPEEKPGSAVTPTESPSKHETKKDGTRSGKKYREYREHREKYRSSRVVYQKLRSYRRSSEPELIRQFEERKALYAAYKGRSARELSLAKVDNATILKYLEYKQYRGYKKYRDLKNDLNI